jgi:hypothetical protein
VNMNAITEGTRTMRPQVRARLAGGFYLLAVAVAVVGEFLIAGRIGFAAVAIPVACYSTVMLLLYSLLPQASRTAGMPAVICGLAGLALEPLRWHPDGVNAAMVLHGGYCLLMGFLIARAAIVPFLAGGAMMVAGMVWLLYLSVALTRAISPWNTAVGLLGESLPMLWLLVVGVNGMQKSEQMGVLQ